jgi:AmmeMemoRadiSam system protein A
MVDQYILLAKNAIGEFVKNGKVLSVPSSLPEEMLKKQAGVFVSIHKQAGELRGCIGTFLPTKENLAAEIIANAIAAATRDPRFLPINPSELSDLVFSVDVLSEPKLTSKENLNPKKFGLIVQSQDGRKGLLLPDLEGVETVEEQIAICQQKGGIAPDEEVLFYSFTVERHQ